jgi:hypothetical protein
MDFPVPLERDVQAACVDWLRLWGAAVVRTNSGGMKVGKRFVRFNSEPGCSDLIVCLPGGAFFALEIKRPGRDRTTKKRKLEQESFRAMIRKSGGLALMCSSLDGLKLLLTAKGTTRRRGNDARLVARNATAQDEGQEMTTEEKLLPTQPGPAPANVAPARDQELALAAGRVRLDGGADEAEGAVGVGAEGRDGGDAHHDDQGQHHSVFNRRRAIFRLQERHKLFGDQLHVRTPVGRPELCE